VKAVAHIKHGSKESKKGKDSVHDLLPMPYQSKRGALSSEERAEYRRRHEQYEGVNRDYLAGFDRPRRATVERVWELLESYFCAEVAALEGPNRAVLVILLDHAITEGARGSRLTFTGVFDAVCRRYSDHHRLCPAGSVYDMAPDTIKACWKDLQNEQVDLGEVYDAVVRKWAKKRRRSNPLFRIELTQAGKETVRRVLLTGDKLRSEFSSIIRRDGSYHSRQSGHRLLFSKPAKSKADRPLKRKICCDTLEYDIVPPGQRSEKILSIQENAELLFHATSFNRDYGRIQRELRNLEREITSRCDFKPRLTSLSTQKRKMPVAKKTTWSARDEHLFKRAIERGLKLGLAPVESSKPQLTDQWTAERVKNLAAWLKKHHSNVPARTVTLKKVTLADAATKEWRIEIRRLLQKYDEYRRIVRDFERVRGQVRKRKGLISVYNMFYRNLNGRYQAQYFWPTFVGEKKHENPDIWRPLRTNWFKAPRADDTRECEELVGLDISSSQTQILAVFLSVEGLEEEASSNSFKGVMSQMAWHRHYNPFDEFKLSMLAPDQMASGRIPNYESPGDPRLQRLCKELWMELCYGSSAHSVQSGQKDYPDTYGRGWTVENASRFARGLFEKYPDVKTYLKACRAVAARAYKRSPCEGVRITDPLDHTTFQWNPIERSKTHRCRHGSNDEVRIQLPRTFQPGLKQYPVDEGELAKRIAPCLIHLLDAFYSSLVMQRLSRSGIENFVGIHDCWLVPERVNKGGKILRGEEVLSRAMKSAAAEWYRGLDCVYRSLRRSLAGDKKYGPWIKKIHHKWKARVRSGYAPVFLWKKETETPK
jgi:hypothetical protein